MTVMERQTRETRVRVKISSEEQEIACSTSVPFLDHMMLTMGRYAGLGLEVEASGDLRHHIIEDVAICFGEALARHAPEKAARFAARTIPMDDALVQCVLDFGGRAYYRGPLPSTLYDHWMRSFAHSAHATLHLRVLRGIDRHHVVEAAFKALGLGLREALSETDAVFSTKGAVSLKEGK